MTRLRLSLQAIVESRAEVTDQLQRAGDAVLIQRGQPRWLLLRCPCGCGEDIPVNIDPRAGKAWRLYHDKNGVSLFPSVWRDTGCESHFIVLRSQIYLFGGYDDVSTDRGADLDAQRLDARVMNAWPAAGFIHFVDVADLLAEIPWDVADSCRRLVRAGFMLEGRGQERGMFKRK